MNYIQHQINVQPIFTNDFNNFLHLPSTLTGFTNTKTNINTSRSNRCVYCLEGQLNISDFDRICECGCKMHKNGTGYPVTLRHLPLCNKLMHITFFRNQLICSNPKCKHSKMQSISFKAEHHFITKELEQYTMELLASNCCTLKLIAELTGLGKNTVKSIDKRRLQENYTIDGKTLIKPKTYSKYIGIDEFKLHNGYKYATHIIDMETGHILWIAHGKKKQVVYDFINHVGLEWMDHVEAIACDMNSDFEEAFEEKCEHIQPVFDYFHIVKNFNDKVVSAVRKDEQKRLIDEGKLEAAKLFKKSRYILMSKRSTLQRKDKDAEDGKIVSKGSELFNLPDITRTKGYEDKYNKLLNENELLFKIDIMKEKLSLAYEQTDENKMSQLIDEIMELCEETENKHFIWFKNLLLNHYEGIIAHASIGISSGKIEGINNKIKTVRRMGYGYPDDEYFFLKLFDMSRVSYTRNPKSHRICD